MTRAFRILDLGAAAVVGPAFDGGYVLLGMQRPLAELFRDVPWGEAGVCQVTVERAQASSIEIRGLDPWYDVDDREGLLRLRADLEGSEGAARAPATARVLKASTGPGWACYSPASHGTQLSLARGPRTPRQTCSSHDLVPSCVRYAPRDRKSDAVRPGVLEEIV